MKYRSKPIRKNNRRKRSFYAENRLEDEQAAYRTNEHITTENIFRKKKENYRKIHGNK